MHHLNHTSIYNYAPNSLLIRKHNENSTLSEISDALIEYLYCQTMTFMKTPVYLC